MNTSSDTSQQTYTLEEIIRQKAEKRKEIQASKEQIHQAIQNIFRRDEGASGTNDLISNITSGIAIFKGIMTGFKIIRRIRTFFRHK